MDKYKIKFCSVDEVELLQKFIDNHWKKGHILAKSKKLLDWQHLDKKHKRYNFVVALNNETKQFDAILGFIPTNLFDSNLNKYKDLWLAIWKVRDDKKNISGLGLNLLFFLTSKLKPNTICSIGITDQVEGIYKALKYNVGIMKHYYIKSESKDTQIAIFAETKKTFNKSFYKLKEIDIIDYKKEIESIIYQTNYGVIKSYDYFLNRYISHPFYKYYIYGIFDSSKLISFFVIRKIIIKNEVILRIVDFQGDFICENLYDEMQKILDIHSATYIDFLCFVEDDTCIFKMGFNKKQEDKEIIPEYFEPFVKKNKQIKYTSIILYKTQKIYISCTMNI